jgi:hypothetical protein
MVLDEQSWWRDELVLVGIEEAVHASAEQQNKNTDEEQNDRAAGKGRVGR